LNRKIAVGALGCGLAGVFIGTAIAGRTDSVERETRVRARVWCEALVERDALRYQESFRRFYFRGTFDRFANQYREPTEAAILAQMPRTSSCTVTGPPRGPGPRGDVYIDVVRRDTRGRAHRVDLRMRREAGFRVVYQVLRR
jgi:hypothetical protein